MQSFQFCYFLPLWFKHSPEHLQYRRIMLFINVGQQGSHLYENKESYIFDLPVWHIALGLFIRYLLNLTRIR